MLGPTLRGPHLLDNVADLCGHLADDVGQFFESPMGLNRQRSDDFAKLPCRITDRHAELH